MSLYLLIKKPPAYFVFGVLVGAGLGSAFYMFFVNRSKNLQAQVVVRLVVLADWIFTTQTIILQLLTGVAMMVMVGWPLASL